MIRPPDETVRSETVYAGRRISVRRDVLRGPDGREFVREVVEHPGAAVVVPVLSDGGFVLVRQFRHAVGEVLLELPAGTLRRELGEETGYRAGKLSCLATVYPSPGVLSEIMWIFLATDLTPGTPDRDPGEEMELVRLSPEEARRLLSRGEIRDAKTMLGLGLALGGLR